MIDGGGLSDSGSSSGDDGANNGTSHAHQRFRTYSPALQNLPQDTLSTPKCRLRGKNMSDEEQVRADHVIDSINM